MTDPKPFAYSDLLTFMSAMSTQETVGNDPVVVELLLPGAVTRCRIVGAGVSADGRMILQAALIGWPVPEVPSMASTSDDITALADRLQEWSRRDEYPPFTEDLAVAAIHLRTLAGVMFPSSATLHDPALTPRDAIVGDGDTIPQALRSLADAYTAAALSHAEPLIPPDPYEGDPIIPDPPPFTSDSTDEYRAAHPGT